MAIRPVFVPDTDPDSRQLVHEHEVDFQWQPGPSPEQRKANIARLHTAAGHRNLAPLLEVSPESDDPLGSGICASTLAVQDEKSYLIPLPAAYRGSMVFTGGGPFTDLYHRSEGGIAADSRLTGSGEHIGFRFMGLEWGIKSGTMFYDWLVIHAIHRYRNLRDGILQFRGFTEIECPARGKGVCHARSCALYAALSRKKLLDGVMADQDLFIGTLMEDSFYKPAEG